MREDDHAPPLVPKLIIREAALAFPTHIFMACTETTLPFHTQPQIFVPSPPLQQVTCPATLYCTLRTCKRKSVPWAALQECVTSFDPNSTVLQAHTTNLRTVPHQWSSCM